ncbi:ABC transporter substrate-binding protein [Pseudomonas veronii]|jgi:iron complex transport system substrate-binding protein|uniref:ABC transporter substrate-binding protein n=1 Tax=Pseudomonas veronii TaxID=76761 RepID=A0A0R3A6P1_PSEVE|nr:ABC transporter substrate-binding protein [Pseudomonas veronii]SEC76260.1 iron complex transport system substrate-binding protein [Pseudomonas marginalis]KRP69024.1 ABC transporter substrate-binding protein [Pseudomonas veronii]MBI6553841.1 ABC transporter substrate-binding protein [Pseudomonas veronii]MBI6648877.1 ABC transporter substrate-binding protein [Pseudomonas veronii]NMX98539.1 ABC transporter substrate-binding protein [Pseudomonas veronii]
MLPRVTALLTGLGLCALAQAAPTQYPLTVENCGSSLTFAQAPARAVTIGQAATEMLYALGVGDKVVGTSLWFNNVLPQFKALNDGIERLANNEPSFESVIAKRPQLVAAELEWVVGPQGVVGTREQFHELKIPTYLLPSDCEAKNNRVGADGTRLEPFRIDTIYKGIRQLAEIFDVQDRGQQLNDELKARLAKSVATVQGKGLKQASALVWFSSAEMASDPYVAGHKGVPEFMLQTLGLRNVVQSDEEWPAVGWETIAKANPTVLVIARMDRRRYPADDHAQKLAFLRSDPVTRNMDAVKHNRIIILDAMALQASVRTFEGLEQLAAAIDGYDLPK